MIRFVFFILLFAVAVYLLVRVIDRRNSGGSSALRPSPRSKGPAPRTIAPDDDEQFLRDLDKKHKQPPEPPAE